MLRQLLLQLFKTIDNEVLLKQDLQTKHFEVDDICFDEILSHSSLFPQFYWRSRDKKNTLLALGCSKYVNFADDIPDGFHIVGGQKFLSDRSSHDWQGFKNEHLYIPTIIFEKNHDHNKIIFNFNEHISLPHLISQINNSSIPPSVRKIINVDELPSKKSFLENFNRAISKMKSEKVSKIVLARKKVFTSQEPIDALALFVDTRDNNKSYNLFFRIDHEKSFISLSPERLFILQNDCVECDSMAGTLPKDQKAERLIFSKKDNAEQQYVTDDIVNKLETICDNVKVEGPPSINKLKYVQHLHSIISGKLKKQFKWFDILKALHPTPAVGGTPWMKAKHIISENEPFDRGHYAAPWGIVSENFSEFLVGIRCALIKKNEIHIFAGAGIVDGSEGENEWQEIESKMQQFTQKI